MTFELLRIIFKNYGRLRRPQRIREEHLSNYLWENKKTDLWTKNTLPSFTGRYKSKILNNQDQNGIW